MQDVYQGGLLESKSVKGQGKKWDWAERDVELWCCLNKKPKMTL